MAGGKNNDLMMFMSVVLVVSLLGPIQSAVGQIIQNGQCNPNIALVPNFSINEFEGQWFEIARSPNPANQGGGGDCSFFRFNVTANGIEVYNSAVNANFLEERNGTATLAPGTANMTLDLTPGDPFDFWILDTDHSIYTVAFNCENITPQHRQLNIWVLSRMTAFPNTMIPAMISIGLTNAFGVNLNDLRSIQHSADACYVLPIIEPGDPIILPGQCDDNNVSVEPNFNATRFEGLWHEIFSYVSGFSQNLCSRAEYTLAGGVVQVENSQVINQTLFSIFGNATVVSTDGSAQLSVILDVGGVPVTQGLKVIATDYENYAVSYSCESLPNNQMRVYSWILGRSRQLTPSVQAAVNDVVASEIVLNDAYYRQTDQSDEACFFFPEPALNKPVVFRGLCESNIPAIPNFNASRYVGIWHLIESYPSAFQTGACNRADYQLGPDGVIVLNTQVINQTLDTMVGLAVVASVDGSGRLNVTFNVSGIEVTTNYLVLDTDYDSYSIVYSCENVDENERQVWSWKLSRFRFLTSDAEVAINNTINNSTAVLDQRFYESVDQSDEGCFYFPKPQLGVPVVFRGQCENVTVVPNFSLNQFEGIWHEIETYPKDQVQGQCINHEYSAGTGNTLNLQTSQITDQFRSITNGTLSFTSTDNSARLNINITSNGETISIPFWILSVNYTDYALAYSCVDIDTEYRAVYSWKLSRTWELSPNAVENIDSTIADVTVLRQEFFEPVEQTNEACFYLPELAPGEPIILVGQCEEIPVVQNFNASRYLGRWNLIESYGTAFQDGTCNQATYSPGANGTVDVFNTQVIDQTLDTILGSASVASTDGSGKLDVVFPNAPNSSAYWILDTDYDSYALVYSCSNLNNNQRRVWSWKLSRTTSLTPDATTAINAVVDRVNVLNNRFYYEIDHSEQGCFYFPEPEYSTPPQFRGRCPNVTGTPNFNATRYQGTWHTIELYPSGTQSGTCSNANYELVGGEVLVLNSDVRNQTLNTISGVASSVDGSGQLQVILNVGGSNQTRILYVLDTDYDTYSLVYACDEIDDEYMQISSWKLSRTKQLPLPAANQINNTISSIQVLDHRYYVPMDQSAEGCFFFPEPQIGVPVRYPGRCDPNVPVVPNFNMTSFQGVWHEISSYPLGENLGQCINHEYEQTSNRLDLALSAVSDLTLNIANGNLTFAPNNNVNNGRLVISIPFDGTLIQIPFWVMSVNYDDHALAYGCVDLPTVTPDQDFRIVYSWKLSRSRQPSQSALAAYNQTIDSLDVLREDYYEDVDQSDEACFHLPEFVPGQVVTFPGQCDLNITVVSNFNASRYLGRWFLIESYPSAFQSGSCNDATYSPGNGVVDVFNTQVVNQTLDTILGSAVVASTDGSGKLLVTFPNAPPIEYWILETDYDTYALVYTCFNVNSEQRNVWSWKLSRTRSLTPEANSTINQIVNSINVLNDRYYEQIDHSPSGCFYFPEHDPNTQVRFRGSCGDDNITPMQNFVAADYLELWHLIESYPTPFQGGTCNNARYTLGPDGVVVFNTQVINQTLDTMTGLAVVASLDGSAMLNVSFPIAGTNETTFTPYWVLATDYESYSLVYTCVDIDEEYKQVWSWKLSRSRQLSPTAIEAINNVTRNHQVLDDRYYVGVDQSPEGCFHFPEPQPGVPVVFPGQCANISVEQNFNLTWFEGVWHEIETYPKEQVSGECVNHEYSAGVGNTLDLLSSQVFGKTLNVNNGTLRFTSDDGSARLSITITVNGTDFVIPFWILNTDYEDYALAYSCVNQGPHYRGVFSWKLSRDRRGLSNDAHIAINETISTVDVLDNKYYEAVDQSDEACFHLPDLAPGEPAIFPGQCDLNIPVVQNFNASRYLGRWRLISSYATEFQSGACNEATYSPSATGVEVFNTQVINQTLDTITGNAVVASTDGSGKLLVTFPNSPAPATYWILETDYDNYSLVYSCRNINTEQRRVYAWILSRDRVLSPQGAVAIDRVVENINVLDYRYFEDIEQSDDACFYFPPADGKPVIFRGQCGNVTTVANFDPVEYLGVWYDIESYPQNFQDGTCPTASYTVGAGGAVNVVNTQVVAQELDTITGTAVQAGNDSSATLIVSFPIAGTDFITNTPYYVLATDYGNYSLVYSCENINEEQRRVTSWKLSRTQNLTADSVAAISEAMEQVPVLQEKYFNYRGHSEEDCFFYPDNKGGPVILSGQCTPPNQVNTVSNFNATLFSGTWFEVSRFPSELQTGECAASDFNFDLNEFTHTIVANESLNTLTGSATVTGSGIISVNFGDGNGTANSTVFVLDVDYNDFALLYSCRNIDNETIQVYSWTLSRSRDGLNQSAIDRIDAIVSSEANLFAGYYEETSQNNSACFHYPDFEELPDFITLTGPCDETIRGVANFNATRYLDRWFEIERYPQPSQGGACNRALYTSSIAGVDVLNSQVVNRTLQTQSGTAVVASTDGTGQLTVTFNVNGVIQTANYYILATDYDNFSLVYSCRNTASGDRIVASWKLSRTTELSPQANAVIDSVIQDTQGLNQNFYLKTDQSPEACFYVPELDPTRAPQFRGTCANVTGMSNFELPRFVAYWNEIRSYPRDTQVGGCISSHFQQTSTGVTFTDTMVFGLRGEVRTGTVEATSNGRLQKTYSDGHVEYIWVVHTDYNQYALMLSCEEVDDEYVRIWSSQYSSSSALLAPAAEAIAPLIEQNDFLYQHLYMPVAQDIDTCFFLPEPNGQRVVLPGRCDSDGPIPTQANFDIVAYTGDWYQIERYPYAEVGNTTCIGTRYTLQGNNSLSVLNWEVDNGTLRTIEGIAVADNDRAILNFVLDYPANFTNAALYILDTDYVSYSLAYSCENLNLFQRSVVAFKLSRHRALTDAASTAINTFMGTRRELNQQYFVQVEQDDDCEEPSSSYLVRSSILVLAICYALHMIA